MSVSLKVIPEIPLVQASQASSMLFPMGETMPKPVTTTLLCSFTMLYELELM